MDEFFEIDMRKQVLDTITPLICLQLIISLCDLI